MIEHKTQHNVRVYNKYNNSLILKYIENKTFVPKVERECGARLTLLSFFFLLT